MPECRFIHVIDSDHRRRARIAFKLVARNVHAEIYDEVSEFVGSAPADGCVMISHGAEGRNLPALLEGYSQTGLELPFVVYADDPPVPAIVDALLAGACDYLVYPFQRESFDRALARMAERSSLSNMETNRALAAKAALDRLTPRETEVMQGLVEGLSNKEIGKWLGVSPRTVEIHRGNLMKKLSASSLSEAIQLAIHAGM